MNKLKVAFNNLISFLSSPNLLIIAFTIKILWIPEVMATLGLVTATAYLAYTKFIEYRNKTKKLELDNKTQVDESQFNKVLGDQHNAIKDMQEKLKAFQAHKELNHVSSPTGMFNIDPNFMRG